MVMGSLQKAALASLRAADRRRRRLLWPLADRDSWLSPSLRSSWVWSRSIEAVSESSPDTRAPFEAIRECAFKKQYFSDVSRECTFNANDPCGKGNLELPSHGNSMRKEFLGRGQGFTGVNLRRSNLATRTTYFRCFSVNTEIPSEIKKDIHPDASLNFPDMSIMESNLPPPKLGQKPRVVILGTGWAASRLMKDLDPALCDIVCVSPRNHMVFTPLLASTCVGTLEFRSVAEPVVRIQSALSKSPNSYFFLGHCTNIDAQNHKIHCITEEEGLSSSVKPKAFTVAYDKLIIASGAQALTFNIRGVNNHAIFLREVSDAQAIRKKLLLNLMLSDIPGTTDEEKKRLLHCVVVGGGPTGVEFSGELSDFIRRDVHQRYAHVQDYIHVTLIEAKEILSSFDLSLRLYAIKHLTKAGVKFVKGVVKDVQPGKLVLSDGSEVPYGLLVWSTGVGPSEFVNSLELPKSSDGRIGIDERLRVPGVEDVYAIGDCAGYVESVGKPVLPALAQVAERQGKYLGKELNRILKSGGGPAGKMGAVPEGTPFVYKHMGSMASVGSYKALVDLRKGKESRGFSWAGFISWLVWRSAYLTRVVSWRNRFYVAVNWATTFVFGRDISRL